MRTIQFYKLFVVFKTGLNPHAHEAEDAVAFFDDREQAASWGQAHHPNSWRMEEIMLDPAAFARRMVL